MASRGVAAVALAMSVTGCMLADRAPVGLTGLSVDSSERLVLAVATCGVAPDGILLQRSGSGGEFLDEARLEGPAVSGAVVHLDLERDPGGWSPVMGAMRVRPGLTYRVGAYSKGAQVSFGNFHFSADSKKKLTTGRALLQEWDRTGDPIDIPVSAAEFAAKSKERCSA